MRVFMCKPTYFDVIHKDLNAHMTMYKPVDKKLALIQYTNLTNFLRSIGVVVNFIESRPSLVDMVFAANGALIDKQSHSAIIATFAASPRQDESIYWKSFLESQNFKIHALNVSFEGQGDALFSHHDSKLWIGHGFRTSSEAVRIVSKLFDNKNVLSLKLIHPKYYHLDTCFCVLNQNCVMYYPDAFDTQSLTLIESNFEDRIIVSQNDAESFACNAVQISNYVILHSASETLKHKLSSRNLTVVENNMSEFLLSGGSVKCCVLHS